MIDEKDLADLEPAELLATARALAIALTTMTQLAAMGPHVTDLDGEGLVAIARKDIQTGIRNMALDDLPLYREAEAVVKAANIVAHFMDVGMACYRQSRPR